MKPVHLNPSLQLMGEAHVKQPMMVELILLNPLPEPLQDCSFTVEGVGLTNGKPITEKYVSYVCKCQEQIYFFIFLWFHLLPLFV